VIPYGRQSIDETDIREVVEVLRSDWLTQGPQIDRFEDALAGVTGARHAVAFSSGTAALHGAAATGGLTAGDLVVTSALSFVASANCARYVGATPGLADIDPETLNIDVAGLPECDGLVAVHYAGLPVDLKRLRPRPRVIIEDAAHALGATTPDGPVGNCAHSDMCAFSFHPVKHITTGEGGAVTTNDDDLAERLRSFRSHGVARMPDVAPWYYEVQTLGFNYRITDLQAALGFSQLRRLPAFLERRQSLADRYRSLLAGFPLELPPSPRDGWTHAYHLFVIRVPDRKRVFEEMRAKGIGVQVHYVPIYRHPLYADLGLDPRDFPETERAYAGLISLPLYPGLTDASQQQVVDTLAASL
jgi:UDP-4-amino-4,6-dideoxy-N-acetyl-beta-L-altrosamine transaminase